MRVGEVYKKFGIPENLQEHMMRVTRVAMMICDGWKDEGIDKELVKKAALVHDLANIVKFKLADDSPLKSKQAEIIGKYGSDDHVATQKMLQELGMDEALIQIVQNKSFGNAIEVEKSGSWLLKILFYSDMRVVPTGVVDLQTRLTDVITRLEKYRNHLQREELLESAKEVERQIQGKITVDLQSITDDLVSKDMSLLLDTEI